MRVSRPLLLLALFAGAALRPALAPGGETVVDPAAANRAGDRTSAESAAEKIEARIRAEDWDEAIAIGEGAVGDDPKDAAVWLALGEAYGGRARSASILGQLKWARKCRAAFEKAVDLSPDDPDAREALLTYYLEAPGIAGGSVSAARAQAEAIARVAPARGHAALGAIAVREKDYAAAETEYRRALDVDPKSGAARAGLGAALVELARYDDARRLWTELLADGDLAPIAHYALSTVALRCGRDLEEGVEHVKRYLASPSRPDGPTRGDANCQLALLYEKLGRRDDAVVALHAALAAEPGHARAKKELKRLGG